MNYLLSYYLKYLRAFGFCVAMVSHKALKSDILSYLHFKILFCDVILM